MAARGILLSCLLALTGAVFAQHSVDRFSDEALTKLSLEAFGEFKSQHAPITSGALYERSRCIMRMLTDHVENVPPLTEWELILIDDPRPNASSMAGGKVILRTGIEGIAPDRDSLALVVASAISRIVLKQSIIRIRDTQSPAALLSGLGNRAQPRDPIAIEFERDRRDTMQADKAAIALMARAGYDPDAAIRTIERMDAGSMASTSREERHAQAAAIAADVARRIDKSHCD